MNKEKPAILYDVPDDCERKEYENQNEFEKQLEHQKACLNCRYSFANKGQFYHFIADDETYNVPKGKAVVFMHTCECRRHAPTVNGFPVVRSDDWCGEFDMSDVMF